jgi:hypothetical protein
MKLPTTSRCVASRVSPGNPEVLHGGKAVRPRLRGQDASAVLIVLILLSLIVALVISNGRVLYHLSEELRLLDRRQQQELQKRFAATESRATNAVKRVKGQAASPKP